ncbi:MAG: hypothetical protein RIR87_1524 [Actinomycetota bacterium]
MQSRSCCLSEALSLWRPVDRDQRGYPEVFRENFVYSCISNGGSEKDCRCILDEMESTYTYERAVELERESLAGEDVSGEFEALFEACIQG